MWPCFLEYAVNDVYSWIKQHLILHILVMYVYKKFSMGIPRGLLSDLGGSDRYVCQNPQGTHVRPGRFGQICLSEPPGHSCQTWDVRTYMFVRIPWGLLSDLGGSDRYVCQNPQGTHVRPGMFGHICLSESPGTPVRPRRFGHISLSESTGHSCQTWDVRTYMFVRTPRGLLSDLGGSDRYVCQNPHNSSIP